MKCIKNCTVVVMAVASMIIAGCGGGGGSNAAVLAAAQQADQQKATAKTNSEIFGGAASASPLSVNVLSAAGVPVGTVAATLAAMDSSSSDGVTGMGKAVAKTAYSPMPISVISPNDLLAPGVVVGKTVKKKTGFDSYSSFMGKITTPTTRSEFTYSVDTSGRLTKQKIKYNYTPMGFLNMSASTRYSYSKDTVVVDSITTPFGVVVNFSYDDLGRISAYSTVGVSVAVTYSASGRIEKCGKYELTYDSHGKIVALTDGTDSARVVRTYDASGNQTAAQFFVKIGSAAEVKIAEAVFTYVSYGPAKIAQTMYDIKTGALSSSMETTNTYTAGGNKATTTNVIKDAAGVVSTTMSGTYSNYSKDSAGNVTRYLEEDSVGMGGSLMKGFTLFTQSWVKLVSGKDN